MLYSFYRMVKHHPYRLLLALYPVHHIINIILPSAKQKVFGA